MSKQTKFIAIQRSCVLYFIKKVSFGMLAEVSSHKTSWGNICQTPWVLTFESRYFIVQKCTFINLLLFQCWILLPLQPCLVVLQRRLLPIKFPERALPTWRALLRPSLAKLCPQPSVCQWVSRVGGKPPTPSQQRVALSRRPQHSRPQAPGMGSLNHFNRLHWEEVGYVFEFYTHYLRVWSQRVSPQILGQVRVLST